MTKAESTQSSSPDVHRITSSIVDRLALYLLLVLTMSYDVQHLVPWISTLRVRECILLFLYVRIVLFYRGWLTSLALHLLTFYMSALVVGAFTFMKYGGRIAGLGTARFIYLALLALPVAVIGRRHMRALVAVWCTVVVVGALTAALQVAGVDVGWLVSESISVRGGLIRFRTILGEPNKGGMASAILLLASATIIRAPSPRVIVLAAALVLLGLSLSKAALVGWVLVILFVVAHAVSSHDEGARRMIARRLLWSAAACAVAIAALISIETPVTRLAREYLGQVTPALTGSATGSKGLSEDLNDRLLARGIRGVELARAQSSWYTAELLVGSSYGVAGSVAVEERGPTVAILPHNSVLELFLVGGLWMLGLFVLLMARTIGELAGRAKSPHGIFAVGALSVLVAYSLSYPIIYEPIMGSLMWILIGSAAGLVVPVQQEAGV